MRRLLLSLSLLLLPILTFAASAPPAFSYDFQVSRNGSPLGVSSMSFAPARSGSWLLKTTVTGTEGLASLAGAGVNESTTLVVNNGELELLSNRQETQLAWKSSRKTTDLDRASRTYVYDDGKNGREVPYQAGLLDQHSLTLAVISDLQAGKTGTLVYRGLSKGRLETFRFRILGEETLGTALGRMATVKVERVRETSNGKSTRIWLAKDRNYAPVLIQENNSNGDDVEMKLIRIR